MKTYYIDYFYFKVLIFSDKADETLVNTLLLNRKMEIFSFKLLL